jgi:nitrogen fixation/metabolism regulation signal transduction histidine kinase
VENELNERRQPPEPVSDELNYAFNRLSAILSLDFNVYSLKGNLLFTTQPRFYDLDLLSPMMNHKAFMEVVQNEKGIYLQNERISSFSYISAYGPIRNVRNNIVGYINIPYYAKQSDLNREISEFLVALINIYVLLFSIAVFSTFIISNRITKPLLFIQQSLKKTKLGKPNEPLFWKRKDEIGSLINEYNRMLEELHRSAEKLARSERENAWREMAKQVAHEIKNPLTPMKLSVQHLERAMKDKHQQLPEIVKRISSTLIEQIDTLSSIASAFSDFAIMPKAETAKLDLIPVLENLVQLYSENDNVNITLDKNGSEHLYMLGDKDYAVRIFTNLIKNAIQAIRPGTKGCVKISVETFIDHFVIAVEDNGQGISEEQRKKIFVPNFTTKTTGTGLGLAMVKALVEALNGEVWFDTEVDKGSTFYVRLPAYKEAPK